MIASVSGNPYRAARTTDCGLPPTPTDVDQFLADASADAYEKLVDRLLASPAYGERWARHWMDVIHFAETHGHDQDVPDEMRGFLFLQFMHSEDLTDQQRCVELYRAAGDKNLSYAEQHRDIIRRFGRFPHRKAVLGRASRPDEQAFLDSGGFAG